MLKKNLRITLLIGMLTFAFQTLSAQGDLQSTPPHPEDTYPTFSLTLRAKAPEFRSGSLVRITITQTNLTKHEIDCSEEWTGIDSSYQYEATDEDGKPAEEKPRGRGAIAGYNCIIPPGKSVDRSILIDRVFKFDRPGKYVIRVSRREVDLKDKKGEPLVVWSSPITITITG
ncbi:MAG: hypothetical protein ABSE51_11170 [Terracidiphilus sp.]|jgi:hypothetical protein